MTEDHIQTRKDPISFGYQKMGQVVQDALNLVGPDGTVVPCAGLSKHSLTASVFQRASLAEITALGVVVAA